MYMAKKKAHKSSTFNLSHLQVPLSIELKPREELENTFRESIYIYTCAIKQIIPPVLALRNLLMNARCFSEIDHNLRLFNIDKIPSNANSYLIYQDMSLGIHKTDKRQAYITSKLRKPIVGKVKISVEHAFMMLIYLAGSEAAIGSHRVDEILEEMNIPSKYKYLAVKQSIEYDNNNNKLWIYRNDEF